MTTEELAVATTAMQSVFLDWTASDERKISQVIVVEGRDDTANLKRYFWCETYENEVPQ